MESLLYTKALLLDLKEADAGYRAGFGLTGCIFAGLAVAYGVALMQPNGGAAMR